VTDRAPSVSGDGRAYHGRAYPDSPGAARPSESSGDAAAGNASAPPASSWAGECAAVTLAEDAWFSDAAPLIARLARTVLIFNGPSSRRELQWVESEFRCIADTANAHEAPTERTEEIRREIRESCRTWVRVVAAVRSGSSAVFGELESALAHQARASELSTVIARASGL
jgi:hypothetical protein